MPLKANVAANFIGQGWRALMALAFVPVYIHILGIEAFGLIGLFASLQLWLSLLDLGVRPVLSREAARYTAGAHDSASFWKILRSLEWVAASVAFLALLLVAMLSPWLATNWTNPKALTTEEVRQAFLLMGAVASIQMMENLYISALAGLQRHVMQNAIMTIFATFRAIGAVVVLMWVDTSIEGYFLWQATASLLSLITVAAATYRVLPIAPRGTSFDINALRPIAGFAAGMVGISMVSIAVTQTDKLILADRLPLSEFGHYALATSVAQMIGVAVAPVAAGYLPRFTQLVTAKDETGLEHAFRMATQLAVLLAGVTATMLIVFGDRLVFLWTQDTALALQVGQLLPSLAIGFGLHAIIAIPYMLQLSFGWTQLAIWLNLILIVMMLPALLYVIPISGALGATWVWSACMVVYSILNTFLMFRRLLPQLRLLWPIYDVGLPLGVLVSTGYLLSNFAPTTVKPLPTLLTMAIAVCLLGLTGIVALPLLRNKLLELITNMFSTRSP